LRLNHPDRGAEAEWVVWLAKCLVETMCEASHIGDEVTVRALVDLCTALGGNKFAGAVCGGVSQSPSRANMTSVQLAHATVVHVLQEHIAPVQEHLQAPSNYRNECCPKIDTITDDFTHLCSQPEANTHMEAPHYNLITGDFVDLLI